MPHRFPTKDHFGVADQAVTLVQRIAGEIRPGMPGDLGLAAALGWLRNDFKGQTGIGCMVAASAPPPAAGGPA